MKRAPSEGREKSDTEGAECSVKKVTSTVPVEVLDTVFEVSGCYYEYCCCCSSNCPFAT